MKSTRRFTKSYEVQYPSIPTEYVRLVVGSAPYYYCPFMTSQLFNKSIKIDHIIPTNIRHSANSYTPRSFKLSALGKTKLHQLVIAPDKTIILLPLKYDKKDKEISHANDRHGLPYGRYFTMHACSQLDVAEYLTSITTSIFITDGNKRFIKKIEKEILMAQL